MSDSAPLSSRFSGFHKVLFNTNISELFKLYLPQMQLTTLEIDTIHFSGLSYSLGYSFP
jgi:hypothetical protein